MIEEIGPVTVLPEKTRIAFQVRMSFAQLTLRRDWMVGHLVLASRFEDPSFTRVETLSPRNHVHHFRIANSTDIDSLRRFTAQAYLVGCQEHLASGRANAAKPSKSARPGAGPGPVARTRRKPR